jgi:hypothetical protein
LEVSEMITMHKETISIASSGDQSEYLRHTASTTNFKRKIEEQETRLLPEGRSSSVK